MAKHFNQGIFQPTNPQKYIGTLPIEYRSSWELTLMRVCDVHPAIHQWASESIKIPYQHPLTGRWANYIPDFLIIYMDKTGKKHCEIVEIKPSTQTFMERAKSKKDKEALVINQAKWKAAKEFCLKQGITFRVMTEEQLYKNAKSK